MTVGAGQGRECWAEFGRRLRAWRRRAGFTQQHLGRLVGYHHSVISRLETGLREPPATLVRLLDSVLETGGELVAMVAAGRAGPPQDRRLFAAPPGDVGPPGPVRWPAALPAEGLPCPVHGTEGCTLADPAAVPALLGRLTAPQPQFAALAGIETELLHALTAALAGLIRGALHRTDASRCRAYCDRSDDEVPATVEGLTRAAVHWAGAVNAAGRLPRGQLRIAAQYAQIAGRLRMQRGQSGIAMAWFGHGLRWAEAADDAPARATLLSDTCALVRLDGDAALTLGYARAIGAVDVRRRWAATLSHLYQARGYALAPDAPECRRQIALARRAFAGLGAGDHAEAPWLAGAEGEMRLESAIGGALRDLAAATGDRTTARRAIAAVTRSRAHLPSGIRGTDLLLTLRLADGWACAGDPAAAVEVAAPMLAEAVRSREVLIGAELAGLNGRLLAGWGSVPEVRRYHEQLLDIGSAQGS